MADIINLHYFATKWINKTVNHLNILFLISAASKLRDHNMIIYSINDGFEKLSSCNNRGWV